MSLVITVEISSPTLPPPPPLLFPLSQICTRGGPTSSRIERSAEPIRNSDVRLLRDMWSSDEWAGQGRQIQVKTSD